MKTLTTTEKKTEKKRPRVTSIKCSKCGYINHVKSLLQYPNNKNKYCDGCSTLLF